MIKIKEWFELVDYRITEGSDYTWSCYGNYAFILDSWNGDHTGHSFTVIFDTRTQEIYEVQAHDYAHNRAYRMINPAYRDLHRKESQEKSVYESQAWDDVVYVDLEVDDDFIQKALAIKEGKDYDTRVSIALEFTDEELLKYMTMAHQRDVTFNQFIEDVLRQFIDDLRRDPEDN